ncbi:MAG: glutamate-1-semialdehyde 2,1-aminomutase [Candidatus Binatia bacterium]
MTQDESRRLMGRATRVIPGGVNSPVRAWSAVGAQPRFVASAKGARLRDVDGVEYIDFVGSWGPMVLGHAHPAVLRAIAEAARLGTSFGAPTAAEVKLAERLCDSFPSVEKVRLVSSGTEATMSALRLARAATGRSKIIKFAGCYHGHSDGLLVRAGSGATTLGVPDSPGVPEETSRLTKVAVYNDLDSIASLCGDDTAAVIVEPVAANMGVVPPQPGFLEGLRRICSERGALLIFDEVITGLRLGSGGFQLICGVTPDLTCLGKVIGGGMPVGAYGGRRELMDLISPAGAVYQAGTLSGNPLAVAAGLATVELLAARGYYEQLEARAALLQTGLEGALGSRPGCVQRVGSILTLFFGARRVINYDEALEIDQKVYAAFFRAMLEAGVWLPPSAFEAWFVSAAHSEDDIDRTVEAAVAAMADLEIEGT